ncbi:MAG: hypothetical protein PHW60_13415 [Kiritimatiellae bacterium]|nr:hypothetical protein [Kiritimatiellia bacterium]
MNKWLLFPFVFIFTVGIAYYGSAQLFEQIGQELSNAGTIATSNIAKDIKKSLGLPTGTNTPTNSVSSFAIPDSNASTHSSSAIPAGSKTSP